MPKPPPLKAVLKDWVVESLRARGGSATLVEVARDIWEKHERELRGMGDLYYTWQYDMRWAATALRKKRVLMPNKKGVKAPWRLR